MHVCRFCKQDRKGLRMFKYAARHWAHYECWLKAKGAEIHDPHIYQGILQLLQLGMHGWQLQGFPVFKLAEWLEAHSVVCPKVAGLSWVDKACWLLKKAIEYAESETVKA